MKHLFGGQIRFTVLCVCTAAIVTTVINSSASAADKPNRFLLLDSRIVEKTVNARLVVGTVEKHKANPLFVEDKAWEMRFDNLYGNVIFDEKENIYKCWYSPFIIDAPWSRKLTVAERKKTRYRARRREMGICYATSKDGLKWNKPELGLMNYDPENRSKRDSGDKKNNIVLRGPHGAGVFRDDHDPDPKRRYKTIYQGLRTSVSPDGLHWAKPEKCQGVRVAGDTHNNAFWAPTLGKYVGITRSWGRPNGRQVARIESDDFVNWTKEVVVLEGESSKQQTYAMPVFFRCGVYIGLIAILNTPSDRTWTELAWSIDTKKWNRISPGTPLIPCSEKKLDYDYGCVYPCAYPVFLKDHIRLYYGGSDYLHGGWRTGSLCLATLRPDGFAGYQPEDKTKPAIVTTTAVPYSGKPIRISADLAESGSIKASVIDADGKVVSQAQTITKTVTDCSLKLSKKPAAGKIRLRFELNNAKLYSFSFGD
ncbi:MAG: hypothetical protein QGG25_00180 [Phycisphaerae bacterium]|jgi:hypothetical protein|nr:hypothetical protein [Phycisphaerae bacterium]